VDVLADLDLGGVPGRHLDGVLWGMCTGEKLVIVVELFLLETTRTGNQVSRAERASGRSVGAGCDGVVVA
jgi:hypothetical protein